MKRCPQCSREYDPTMTFCLDDGAELLYGPASDGPASMDEPQTAILPGEEHAQHHSGGTSAGDQAIGVLEGGHFVPDR